MHEVTTLDALADLVEHADRELFVRWSRDVDGDLDAGTSRDELTGIGLPGLSANGLAPEPWWDGRELRTWVARKLYDYHRLRWIRGDARPWVVTGRVAGRGPDNEPLVCDATVVARIDEAAVHEAVALVESFDARWGGLERNT